MRAESTKSCERCGEEFSVYVRPGKEAKHGRFCSRKCANQAKRLPAAERFWLQVEMTLGCWLWKGSRSDYGYGRLRVSGRTINAHRFSWELAHGPIPKGVEVCHNCPGGDNPACVNPDHLFLGTHTENMQDKLNKDGAWQAWGAANGSSKLTTEKVLAIRARHAAKTASIRGLAREFGVSQRAIQFIVRREKWKNI